MKFLVIILLAVWIKHNGANIVFDEVDNIGVAQANLLFYLTSPGAWACEHHTHEDLLAQHRKAVDCVKSISYDSSFCSTFLQKFKPCVKPLLEKTGQCDNPFMNDLKNTVVDVVMAEIKYFCDRDGEHMLELINPCATRSALQGYDCKTKVMKPYQSTWNLTKVCGVFPDVLGCLENEIHNECPNEMTRKTLHEIFTLDIKPCNVAIEGYMEFLKFITR